MIIIAYIILGVLLLRLLITIINALTKLHLSKNHILINEPLVSILIPARNEELNIGKLLNDIQKQEYKNYEVIVYNDESEDETCEIVNEFVKEDNRVRIINGDPVPEGWIGKNYACYRLSLFAKGKFFLFLDADVRMSNNIIENALAFMQKRDLKLFSVFPKQEMHTIGEKCTVPLMNWILLSILPMFLIYKSRRESLSAANGQFMLFDAENYRKHIWHEIVKNYRVEDIRIIQLMKKAGNKVTSFLGNSNIRCRMYPDYRTGIKGFSKNVIVIFCNSILFMLSFTFVTVFGVIFIAIFLSFKYVVLYVVASVLIHIIISWKSRQPVFYNLLFLVPRQFTFVIIVLNSLYIKIFRKATWKGRPIILN